MLRRIPSTLLVCLVIFLLTIPLNDSWAADSQEALDILLKPSKGSAASSVTRPKATTRPPSGVRLRQAPFPGQLAPGPPFGITKVKAAPQAACGVYPWSPPCILPQPRPGQWDMSAQLIFARTRGTIAWPRVSQYQTWNSNNEIDLNDVLGVPAHYAIPSFTAKYQFRCNWGLRYSILGAELSGSGGGWNSQYFYFGNSNFTFWGYDLQTKWDHLYQRIGLVYDPIKTCSGVVSLFADWVHTDDKLTLSCGLCGYTSAIWSKSCDMAMVGIEYQNCLKSACNGGTLSLDCKAGFMFYDDCEGWDISAAARYSVPLNCGRWGYMKGGYRFIQVKKSQVDLLWMNTIEGGFIEAGFIF